MSKLIDHLPLPPLHYHGRETSYWRRDDSQRWIKVNDTSARSFIAEHSYSKCAGQAGTNSEVDRCLMAIQASQNVSYVGPLAGYNAGLYRMANNQILVTDSPVFIQPRAGEWPTLEALFNGLFVEGGLDQRVYFYGWIKNALESFHHRRWKASQLLAMAGPVKAGKSLVQNLLTVMFGGRSAKPYAFMMGQTTFNSHMFCGEHQILEDEAESIDIRARRHFAANIKTILTGRDQNCHGKNREALVLSPLWRMSLSLNDDPERLQVLPPLDGDVRDKIILLKANRCAMPMPTGDPIADERFWNQLVGELPAFLHYLDAWEVPERYRDTRYGIVAYQHPELVEKLEQTAPQLRLLELVDLELFEDRIVPLGQVGLEPWDAPATALEARLVNPPSRVAFEARKLLAWQNSCGTYLGRLEESGDPDIAGRVTSRKCNGHTIWTIRPPLRTAPPTARQPACQPGDTLPSPPPGLGR